MKRRIIITFLFIVLCMPLGLLTGCLKTNGVLEQGFKIQNSIFEFIKEGKYSDEDIKDVTLYKDDNGIEQNIKLKEINIKQTFDYKELSLDGDIIAPINVSENDILNCINLITDWDKRNSNNELYINGIREAKNKSGQKININQDNAKTEFYIQVLNDTVYIHTSSKFK